MDLRDLQKEFKKFKIKASRKEIIRLKNKARYGLLVIGQGRGYAIILSSNGLEKVKKV